MWLHRATVNQSICHSLKHFWRWTLLMRRSSKSSRWSARLRLKNNPNEHRRNFKNERSKWSNLAPNMTRWRVCRAQTSHLKLTSQPIIKDPIHKEIKVNLDRRPALNHLCNRQQLLRTQACSVQVIFRLRSLVAVLALKTVALRRACNSEARRARNYRTTFKYESLIL